MATETTKRNNTKISSLKTKVEAEETATTTVAQAEPIAKPAKKEYKATDGIPCKSITAGELGMIGIKSGILYRWACQDDVTEVEYQDLVAGIRSSADSIMRPRFLVLDDDFVKDFPSLKKVYDAIYTVKDLKEVLKMPIPTMKKTINSLPEGAKETIKSLAASQVRSGQLDSVNKIKALDEIFNVKFMLMTNLTN